MVYSKEIIERFESMAVVKSKLDTTKFELNKFTNQYVFVDSLLDVYGKPSDLKSLGYLNGMWVMYQQQLSE